MGSDTAAVDPTDAEVMASVDAAADRTEFVIADVSRDGAWLSAPAADAPQLPNWR